LEAAGIATNRNVVPRDADTPGNVSGLRLGTCAIAYRGMGPAEMDRLAGLIDQVLRDPDSENARDRVGQDVQALCRQFPVYAGPKSKSGS
jgi:glycine hydroxymethyltransferase